MYLPSETELEHETVGELAARLYPDITFDYALPQSWVDIVRDRGFDPRGKVVWGYPKGSLHGFPLPLTWEAAISLLTIVAYVR